LAKKKVHAPRERVQLVQRLLQGLAHLCREHPRQALFVFGDQALPLGDGAFSGLEGRAPPGGLRRARGLNLGFDRLFRVFG